VRRPAASPVGVHHATPQASPELQLSLILEDTEYREPRVGDIPSRMV